MIFRVKIDVIMRFSMLITMNIKNLITCVLNWYNTALIREIDEL